MFFLSLIQFLVRREIKSLSGGNPFRWSKRYEAVGLMEDLLGFYKMLL